MLLTLASLPSSPCQRQGSADSLPLRRGLADSLKRFIHTSSRWRKIQRWTADGPKGACAPTMRNGSLQIPFKCPTLANIFEIARQSRFAHFGQAAEYLASTTHKPHLNFLKRSHFRLGNVLGATTPRHLNLQKWSYIEAFCTFLTLGVLCATMAYTLSMAQFLKVLEADMFCAFWHRHVLCATKACNFPSPIRALASLPFNPVQLQTIGKTQ